MKVVIANPAIPTGTGSAMDGARTAVVVGDGWRAHGRGGRRWMARARPWWSAMDGAHGRGGLV
jgi:hypothetical protein